MIRDPEQLRALVDSIEYKLCKQEAANPAASQTR